MFEKIRNFMNDLLDRPVPTIRERKENRLRKREPVKYVTQKYVESINLEEQTKADWISVSNNLAKLSEAQKNYTQNDPKPSYIRKTLGVLGAIASIFCITGAEKFDVFPTKAWAHVYKERDQD